MQCHQALYRGVPGLDQDHRQCDHAMKGNKSPASAPIRRVCSRPDGDTGSDETAVGPDYSGCGGTLTKGVDG
jgi:hypothetical protein